MDIKIQESKHSKEVLVSILFSMYACGIPPVEATGAM